MPSPKATIVLNQSNTHTARPQNAHKFIGGAEQQTNNLIKTAI
jgi:hypothetical protein